MQRHFCHPRGYPEKNTTQAISQNTRRHSLKYFLDISQNFYKFQACDPTINTRFFSTIHQRINSTKTPGSGAFWYVEVYSYIVSRGKRSRSYTKHSHHHLHRSLNASTPLYPGSSSLNLSASVISSSTYLCLGLFTSYMACLYPSFLPPQTRTIFSLLFSNHTVHMCEPLQNLPTHSIKDIFSHTNSTSDFLFPSSIHLGTRHILRKQFIPKTSRMGLSPNLIHQPTKIDFFQNALEIYTYSGAEWSPKHDVAFRFSLN